MQNLKGEIKMKEFYPEGFLRDDFKNKKAMQSLGALITAQDEGQIMEANVIMCDAEHNMTVDLGIMRGIIPREEGAIGIAEGITRDIALISRVGKPVSFVINDIKVDEFGRPCAYLSRKSAQELCKKYITDSKRTGDVINAKVTHLESFGAFCDIVCGNVALLPIDAISVSRISHPRDRFKVGDDIRVVIKSIADDGRITLSHKELLGTWEENAALLCYSEQVT